MSTKRAVGRFLRISLVLGILLAGAWATSPALLGTAPQEERFGFVDFDTGWASTPRIHQPLSALASDGAGLFAQLCSPCHGERGRGDGRNYASELAVRPRDLSDPSWLPSVTNEHIARVVRSGSQAVGLSNLCPPWGRVLDRERARQVVRFVRQLGE